MRDLQSRAAYSLCMNWKVFHHPDISLPVIRRKAGEELITLLAGTSELLLSRGLSTIYSNCYPSSRAFQASVKRLQKKGLITQSTIRGELPSITLSPCAEANLPPYCNPDKFWHKRWNKWWYLLMFDVPEINRSYRDTLRAFLKKQRLGCLQKSVWVTPQDIRADYDDLNRAASVDSIAFLFEAKTVLGFGNQSVVREAWNFHTINKIQKLYIQIANENIALLNETSQSRIELLELLRMDNLAYAQAMSTDPLLPEELHPSDYSGLRVAEIHRDLTHRAIEKM